VPKLIRNATNVKGAISPTAILVNKNEGPQSIAKVKIASKPFGLIMITL
jgi:hypothetical protein